MRRRLELVPGFCFYRAGVTDTYYLLDLEYFVYNYIMCKAAAVPTGPAINAERYRPTIRFGALDGDLELAVGLI